MAGTLGRLVPTTWEHYDKYPISALAAVEVPSQVPVVLGVNWYSNFDNPVKEGNRWWIGRGDLGTIRGGHCVCVKSAKQNDLISWWDYYNQGNEGACVGFGSTRAMSLLNRTKYDAFWLYHEAQKVDEWEGESYTGTSVNGAMKVLAAQGHVPAGKTTPKLEAGIAAYRWASKVDEVREVLRTPLHDKLGAVPILNSWGRNYPHITWMPYETLQRLIDEDGEAAIITDR